MELAYPVQYRNRYGQAAVVDPLFWLGLSIALLAVSLASVVIVALPTLRDLARAARSAEKLFDTLRQELPPTLESLRLTGLDISDLTDDVSAGVQHAGRVVQQVDAGMSSATHQAKKVGTTTRGIFRGVRVAWRTLTQPQPKRRSKSRSKARSQHTTRQNRSQRSPKHPHHSRTRRSSPRPAPPPVPRPSPVSPTQGSPSKAESAQPTPPPPADSTQSPDAARHPQPDYSEN